MTEREENKIIEMALEGDLGLIEYVQKLLNQSYTEGWDAGNNGSSVIND